MAYRELLKKDLFGEIRVEDRPGGKVIVRDTAGASAWVRWLARALMQREARALAMLDEVDGIPRVEKVERFLLVRQRIEGEPLQLARTRRPDYYREAAKLLRCVHRSHVVHNDLAKEPNLLVRDDGTPAFVDFQLAVFAPGRGRLFRLMAWDDIRHLLKHKRSYCPEQLTAREKRILDSPSLPSRLFRTTIKPVYLFVTRRLLGWSDREGAGDRGARH
jgi:RIO-like serine/threonine protein kinase